MAKFTLTVVAGCLFQKPKEREGGGGKEKKGGEKKEGGEKKKVERKG